MGDHFHFWLWSGLLQMTMPSRVLTQLWKFYCSPTVYLLNATLFKSFFLHSLCPVSLCKIHKIFYLIPSLSLSFNFKWKKNVSTYFSFHHPFPRPTIFILSILYFEVHNQIRSLWRTLCTVMFPPSCVIIHKLCEYKVEHYQYFQKTKMLCW